MKRICVIFALTLSAVAHATQHCDSIERDVLQGGGSCIYMGAQGKESDSILITPKSKITTKKAFDILISTAATLEVGGVRPKQIAVLTDERASGDSLVAEGQPIRMPNAKDPAHEFKKTVKICRVVDWEARCKPYK